MNDVILKRLNPTQSIIDAMPSIIEAFVMFYGESERENIQNKFKNLVVVGYTNEMKSIVNRAKQSPNYIGEYAKIVDTYDEYVEKCDKLKEDIEKKYKKLLINDLKDLFTEEEFVELDSQFNTEELDDIAALLAFSNTFTKNNKSKNFFGLGLGIAYIDAFNEKSNKLLLNSNTNEKTKSNIKNDRVMYFKNLGLDLGDNYEDYMNYPNISNFLPSKEMVERVITTRQKRQLKMKKEYYNSLPHFQANRERINSYDLLNKNDGYDESIHEFERCCIIPNLKQIGEKVVPFPILCFPTVKNGGHIDASLIHELNHVLELYFQNNSNNKNNFLCGWDLIECDFKNNKEEVTTLEKSNEKRNYEYFNEIINELITQEITKILFSNNNFLFDKEEEAYIESGSSYNILRVIVKEFYDIYKQEILESRKNGNIHRILEAVGKENFENLNQLICIFKKEFPENGVYNKTIDDINKGINNEKTQKYREIMNTKQQILSSMESYYSNNKITR